MTLIRKVKLPYSNIQRSTHNPTILTTHLKIVHSRPPQTLSRVRYIRPHISKHSPISQTATPYSHTHITPPQTQTLHPNLPSQKKMGKKTIITIVSSTIILAAIIGIIAASARSRHLLSAQLSLRQKSISALCSPTIYKDACQRTLLSASISPSSTAGDIIRAAVRVISSEVASASAKAHDLHPLAKTTIDNDGFEFCKDLLADAGDQLSAVITEADNGHRIDDFQAWLSMVISYRTNCLASVEAPELNRQMGDALRNATELADNAIAITTVVAEIVAKINATARRLGEDGGLYPGWVGAGDRRMLGAGVGGMRANAVVAKDGSGGFRTIGEALEAMPESYRGRYVIYVKEGVYEEKVTVGKEKANLLIYGDGPRKTIVTGRLSYAQGVGTYKTATFCKIVSIYPLLFEFKT